MLQALGFTRVAGFRVSGYRFSVSGFGSIAFLMKVSATTQLARVGRSFVHCRC